MTGLHRVVNRQKVRVPKRQFGSGENGVFVPGREHDGRMRTIWKAEVVHGESFRGVFTVFLKMKSGHWALEACRGVSLKRSKLAFCFCF